MRVIIAGSRTLTNPRLVTEAVEASGFVITEVFSGCAKGIDRLGERWAAEHNVPVRRFPVTAADWQREGLAAGHNRNRKMADSGADGLVLVWDGVSGGSKNMLDEATKRKLCVYVHRVSDAAD